MSSASINPFNENNNSKREVYKKQVPLKEWPVKSVDQFTKILQVGEGTFGKVYKAKYNHPNNTSKSEIVALKKILMENEKEGFPITAIREIMILKRLNHKNIMTLLDIVTSKPSDKNKNKGNVYLVFEYMEHDISGLSNLKVVFPVPAIKSIMYQLLNGVKYLHMNNIIHRDIKSANILLNNKGEIKIGDFGLARIINPNPNIIKKYTNRVVTLWYRAPELLLGTNNYGTPIDVWSIGCVFAELLISIPLFKGLKEMEQIEKIFEKLGTPTEETWPNVTSFPLYSQLAPRTKYDYCLREFFKDNNKVDDVSFDLLNKMLQLDPNKRISIDDAMKHDYFNNHSPPMCKPDEIPKIENDTHEYQSRKEIKAKGNAAQIMNNPNAGGGRAMIISKQNYQSNNYYNKNNPNGLLKRKIAIDIDKEDNNSNKNNNIKEHIEKDKEKGNILETLLSKKNENEKEQNMLLGKKRENDEKEINSNNSIDKKNV